MKIIVDGKETEFFTEDDDRDFEFDLPNEPDNNEIDLEDTIQFSKEQLDEINNN